MRRWQPALPESLIGARQAEPVSDCIVNLRTAVSPPVILLGEDTLVTLHAKALCPTIQPLHLVFVLGEPGAMQGDPINQLSRAVKAMIRSLKLADNPSTQVGIVAFQSSARTLCKLMNDEGRLLSCAGKLAAHGGTAIDRGIIQGLKDLADGRRGLDPNVEPNEVMIVVTNSMNGAGCDPVKSAARRAKYRTMGGVTYAARQQLKMGKFVAGCRARNRRKRRLSLLCHTANHE
mgnify:CR=1 FL=1